MSKGVAVLLTDPSGRSIGFDASTGKAVNDFVGSSLGYAASPRRSSSFGLPRESLVPGEYVLTAVGSTLDTNQTYKVQLGSASVRGDDVVFSQTLVASGTVKPNSDIEPFRFTLSTVPEPSGDFNGDGLLTTFDIDLLMNEVAAGTDDGTVDLNNDGTVDDGDRDEWLTQSALENEFAESFLVGDSNLDGTVDSIDLNALALNWRGGIEVNDWTKGNFTGAAVNSIDLNALALNWRQSTTTSQAVPEPTCLALVAVAGLIIAAYRRPTTWKRTRC